MTLLTEFKDKTASLARLLTAAMTSMLLLGILAPSGSGGTNDGLYNDASGVIHAFRRAPEGTITTFDIPGAGTGPGQGTFAGNINPQEAIAGRYVDASDVAHGFLRTRSGIITTFDAPNAG